VNALWDLPAPLDVMTVGAVRAVIWLAELLVVTPTRNMLRLGIGFAIVYWLAVWASLAMGRWGADATRHVRKGNDFFEFAPGRSAGWGWIVGLIRFQVVGEAWVAGVSMLVGYACFAGLVVIGVMGEWLAVLVGAWALRRALAVRARRRGPWWQVRSDVDG
jgi:hypothetical protein